MADYKYPDYTPVDEPVTKDYKPPVVGSGIKVEKLPEPKPTPKVIKKASGGSVSSASSRADGIAQRGKTRA